jgi:hypothetical protein
MKKTVLANIYTLKTNKQKKISEAKEFIDGIYNKSVGKVLRIIEVNNASEESDFNNYIIIDNDNRPNSPAIKPTEPPAEDIKNYFRFLAVEDSNILLSGMDISTGEPDNTVNLYYSKDGSTWTQYDFTVIPLSAGETLYM